MEYVNLGRSGLKVSRICLGMMSFGTPTWRPWVLDEAASRPFVQKALEAGINFFDTSNMYSQGVSEEVTGRALRDFAQRDEVVIATKVFFPTGDKPNQRGNSRVHIMKAVDDSLRRLGTDYIDLYQIHRWDSDTPIEETLAALHDVVKVGKARYIGASSMYAWQFTKALYLADLHGWTRFISMQNHYNLVYREEEREMLPLCRAEGIGILPWSPLARGFLAGNRKHPQAGETERARTDAFAQEFYSRENDYAVLARLQELSSRLGYSTAQLALAWILHQPGITSPIIGATKMVQFEESLRALEIHLSPDDLKFLEEVYTPHPVLGHS